tara:strand:+ start:60 stop:728 length:669 start_codon:yes stop_codon:yes gene_type:complete
LKYQKKNQWWNKKGNFRILHKINPIRVKYILKIFNKPLRKKNVLDIGCGGGLISEALANNKANVIGIDENNQNLKEAKVHAKISKLKVNYVHSSFNNFYKKNKIKFDLIICLEFIEHVENFEETLKKITKLIKPNGMLILSTINRNVKSLIFAKIFAEYVLNWIPIGTHEFKNFLKPSEIISILKRNNLKIRNIKGLEFNPVENKWSLTNNTNINYFLVAQK